MSDLRYGRDRLGDPEVASRLEWLVTNGIGGFASGTVGGAPTRRYHGLLFAALKPPLGRTLLLSKLAESVDIDATWIELDTNRWGSGALHPKGLLHLESFRLEDTVPTWLWAIGDTRLEKRVWMEQGENTTYVQYRLITARGPIRLSLKVLVNHRDSHALTHGETWPARVEPATGGLRVEMYEGATPLWLLAPGAEVRPQVEWYRDYLLSVEADQGLDHLEDHLFAGELVAGLAPGETFTVVASTRRDAGVGKASGLALASALARRRAHERSLVESWRRAHPFTSRAPSWVRQLVLAADGFIVERSTLPDPNGRTVIAGYPRFNDRGRDTMIALPGLTLATGRPEVARAILTTFARHVDRGMIPNRFVDGSSETAQYDSVDAALWLYQAVRAYHDRTQDDAFLAGIYPVLEDIGAWYERGTRHGIGVDPDDGLLRAGEPGVSLTWMDAHRGGDGITPRLGKPVEVNALWYNALTSMARFAKRLKRPTDSYDEQIERMERAFSRFWNPAAGCLFDVLDGPEGHDSAVRPNQLLAISLPESPLNATQRRSVLETCGRLLLTSHGLRSLAPGEPRYRGVLRGDRQERDEACHNGSAWTWLVPHFALAYERVHGDRQRALQFLEPIASLIQSYGVGSLPEIADGNLPHAPWGCIAQASAVGEALRAYHVLGAERKRVRRRAAAPAEATAAV